MRSGELKNWYVPINLEFFFRPSNCKDKIGRIQHCAKATELGSETWDREKARKVGKTDTGSHTHPHTSVNHLILDSFPWQSTQDNGLRHRKANQMTSSALWMLKKDRMHQNPSQTTRIDNASTRLACLANSFSVTLLSDAPSNEWFLCLTFAISFRLLACAMPPCWSYSLREDSTGWNSTDTHILVWQNVGNLGLETNRPQRICDPFPYP